MLEVFCALFSSRPSGSEGKVISTELFNSDWRDAAVIHRCHGCCPSLEETQRKMKVWIGKLLKSLGRKLLNRGNWLHWQNSFSLVGVLMSMHALFLDVFSTAISKASLLPLDDGRQNAVLEAEVAPGDEDADRMARWRMEQAEHRQKAMDWLQDDRARHDLYVCRVSLEGEVQLMKGFVSLISREWEVQNLSTMISQGHRQFRVNLLKDHVGRFMTVCTEQMLHTDLWAEVTVTGTDVTMCWRALLRPMAVVFQLVAQQINTFFH